jgi:hypothetical protein
VCLASVDKYVTLLSSPLPSIFQSCRLSVVLMTGGVLVFTYSDIVVTSAGRKAAFAVRFKVGRVDGRIIVVPGHEQRSCLHRGWKRGELAARELYIGCVVKS